MLRDGIHASTAARIARFAQRAGCEILVRAWDSTVDAREMLSLMSLSVPAGVEVTLSCRGQNAQRVWAALARYLSGEDPDAELGGL